MQLDCLHIAKAIKLVVPTADLQPQMLCPRSSACRHHHQPDLQLLLRAISASPVRHQVVPCCLLLYPAHSGSRRARSGTRQQHHNRPIMVSSSRKLLLLQTRNIFSAPHNAATGQHFLLRCRQSQAADQLQLTAWHSTMIGLPFCRQRSSAKTNRSPTTSTGKRPMKCTPILGTAVLHAENDIMPLTL